MLDNGVRRCWNQTHHAYIGSRLATVAVRDLCGAGLPGETVAKVFRMITLTRAEIAELTGRRQRTMQRARLTAMGIPYIEREDGALVVSRKAAERALGAGWPSDDRDDWCSDCPRRHRIELP